MRTPLKFVVLVGVALSVTPIFSSLFAQQSGARGDLFMEMQGLRSEVAELRDMVERQQHQMKKLQRSLDQKGSQGQPYSGQQGYQPAPSGIIDGSATQYTENPIGSSAPTNPSDQAEFPANSTLYSSGSTANSVQQFPNSSNRDIGNSNDTYSSNTSGAGSINSGVLSSAEYPVTNSIPIEERVIGSAKLPTSQQSYPPVIERSIGGTDNNADSDAQISVLDAGFAGGEQVATAQNPIDASVTPQSPSSIEDSVRFNRGFGVPNDPMAVPGQGGSGVIAIPNSSAGSSTGSSVSDNSFPGANSNQQAGALQTAAEQARLSNTQATGLSEQDYYQRGFALLKDSKHSQAVNIFKQQISSYPQGSYADDAHYWIAESMYVNRSLDDSKQYFRAIIDNYSQSPRLPDAMLKTAYIEQEQGNVIEARILLQEIIQYHPRSNAAISAKNRLPELK